MIANYFYPLSSQLSKNKGNYFINPKSCKDIIEGCFSHNENHSQNLGSTFSKKICRMIFNKIVIH